jgi:N-terminal domain of reverse transcriptase
LTVSATPTGAVSHATMDWHAIEWGKVHRNVRRLQMRIVKALQAGRWGKVRALQHLLTRSFSAKVLAIQRVTDNPGKRTPGIDQVLWDSPGKKAAAIGTLRPYPSPQGARRGTACTVPHGTMLLRRVFVWMSGFGPVCMRLRPYLVSFGTSARARCMGPTGCPSWRTTRPTAPLQPGRGAHTACPLSACGPRRATSAARGACGPQTRGAGAAPEHH